MTFTVKHYVRQAEFISAVIHNKVERKKFKGKAYLVLKATYNVSVGKDTWYFYFDPKTYAMENISVL